MRFAALASDRATWAAVGAVTLLGAVLRLATLGLQSYEFDEGATLYVIRGWFTHMLHGVARYESTPPLYYVLAWVWSQAFGTGETGLRLFSAIAGVATVPVVYAVGRALGSRRIGLVAAAIVATSPYPRLLLAGGAVVRALRAPLDGGIALLRQGDQESERQDARAMGGGVDRRVRDALLRTLSVAGPDGGARRLRGSTPPGRVVDCSSRSRGRHPPPARATPGRR